MSAPCRPTPRGPVLTRRLLARGSLVGVGLLAATTAAAPAALAADDVRPPGGGPQDVLDDAAGTAGPLVAEPVPVAPAGAGSVASAVPAPVATLDGFFGRGKSSVTIQVAPPAGTAPEDLDLSGTEFTLTANGVDHTCSATAAGTCTFSVGFTVPPGLSLPGMVHIPGPPTGTHPVRQTKAAPGLELAPGTGSIELCASSCTPAVPPTVHNASTYSNQLSTTVLGSSGGPVRNARVELGGPDYPHRTVRTRDPLGNGLVEGLAPASAATFAPLRATTGPDGSVSFGGWFPAASGYTLTPLTADDQPAGAPASFPVAGPGVRGGMVQVPSVPIPSVPGEPERTPAPAPAPVAVPAPSTAPVPARAAATAPVPARAAATAPAPAAAATGASRSGGAAVSASSPAATTAAPTTSPAPVAAAPPALTPSRSSAAPPSVAVRPEAVALETVDSSAPVAVLGGGVVLVVALVVVFAWSARRRAQFHG
jgi:hypothetical protein